jgi:hypothetical protein
VTLPDFVFELHLADRRGSEDMLNELAENLLHRVGYGGASGGELAQSIRAACAEAPEGAPCSMRFRVDRGELQVAVTFDRHEWHTTRKLP